MSKDSTIEISAEDMDKIRGAIEEAAEVFDKMAGGIMVTYEAELNRRREIMAGALRIIKAKS